MVFDKLRLNSPEDAVKLNELACKYNGKLNVNCGSSIIDAKSLLALLTLIGKKNIKLVAPDHDDPNKFAQLIKKI